MQTYEHLDVLIIGAGLSGIDAAYHLQTACRDKSYAILEARAAIGGTWDLFRYPGVRSDSDMHTLGFPFWPWHAEEAIAEGPAIRDYIRDTAAHFGISQHIRFGHRVARAFWSSIEARWTVEVQVNGQGQSIHVTCKFLYMCTGYYDYSGGFSPVFAGTHRFKGQIVHPQKWPDTLDYAGKRIVVIGSGATAVTLVPVLAVDAGHVTMLQRSPTYVVSRAAKDAKASWLYRRLPKAIAAKLIKWKNVAYGIVMFHLARSRPEKIKRMIIQGVRQQLPVGYDIERHFTPGYNPWDQRICLVPNGDLFAAMRAGRVDIVTGTFDSFIEHGIRLTSGETVAADIVVSATGLVMKLMGGVEILIDGVPVRVHEKIVYKGAMLSDVPNLAFAFGYTNASWTLRCDLSARYVCRLLNYMDRKGYSTCVPRPPDPSLVPEPLSDFSSGYIRRAEAVLPKQGQAAPWRIKQNYVLDVAALTFGSIRDGAMNFYAIPGVTHK